MMRVEPCTLRFARAFVAEHHRHNLPPRGHIVSLKVVAGDRTVGVAIAGRPVARHLDDGTTAEITRVCVIPGQPNACSFAYGRIRRALAELGFTKVVSYTLASESGSCLRAAGFRLDAELDERPTWDGGQRHRVQVDLFGHERRPAGPKRRWVWP